MDPGGVRVNRYDESLLNNNNISSANGTKDSHILREEKGCLWVDPGAITVNRYDERLLNNVPLDIISVLIKCTEHTFSISNI